MGETDRLISNITEVADLLKMNRFLVTMDIGKTFHSFDNLFLMSVLKKFFFGEDFMSWIKTVPKNQEPCVINSCKTTHYFKLQRGTR